MPENRDPPPLASHVGREQAVAALGRIWKLSRWDRAVWRDFLEWAKAVLPDPRAQAAEFLKILPNVQEYAAERQMVVAEALKAARCYLSPNSPEVLALLGSMDGVCKVVWLLLKANHPDATEDTAYDLVLALGQERMQEVLKGCAGLAPPKGGGESQDSQP